jgi:O-succinylbenzoic acid--CoA ligase
MEFDLNKIKREWIAGISGEALLARVSLRRQQLQQCPASALAQGVLITEKNPLEFATLFFAAASLQIPIILANPNWGQQEWQELGNLVAPTSVFGKGFTCEDRDDCDAHIIDQQEHTSKVNHPPAGSILIPTGGSTGGVKLAIHTWDTLAAACAGVQSFLGGGPVNSCCVLPLYHVSGLMQLLRAYHTGGYLRFDEDEIADTCVSYVPTQLQRALSDPERTQKLASARAIFVGGAAMSEPLIDQTRAAHLPVVPVYGMTETAAMVAAVPAESFLANPAAGALSMGDARIEISLEGRICIDSPSLFKGYHGRPPMDLSQGYLTDDEGHIDSAGHLHVIGRIDRLINSGGEKIDPREIEVVVAKLTGVDEVLAIGESDPEWGQKLVVYYTGTELSHWKNQLQTQLAKYKVPKEMRWVERLPLDEKGKYQIQT